jgi:hypothetical protein
MERESFNRGAPIPIIKHTTFPKPIQGIQTILQTERDTNKIDDIYKVCIGLATLLESPNNPRILLFVEITENAYRICAMGFDGTVVPEKLIEFKNTVLGTRSSEDIFLLSMKPRSLLSTPIKWVVSSWCCVVLCPLKRTCLHRFLNPLCTYQHHHHHLLLLRLRHFRHNHHLV